VKGLFGVQAARQAADGYEQADKKQGCDSHVFAFFVSTNVG